MWNLAKIIKATAIVCDRNRSDHYSYEETTEAIQELNTQMAIPSVFRLRKKFVMDHERGIDIALSRKDKHFDYQAEKIIPVITNQSYMESLPVNTVGASYGHLIKQWSFFDLWERRLTEDSKASDTIPNPLMAAIWTNISRHIFISHDFWHVMARYDTSRLGEACIMGITHTAIKTTGAWYIAHAIAAKMCWEYKSILPWKAVRESIRIGNAINRDFWDLNPLEIIEEDVEKTREKYNVGVCEEFIRFNNTFKEEFRNDNVHPEYNDPKTQKLVAQEI